MKLQTLDKMRQTLVSQVNLMQNKKLIELKKKLTKLCKEKTNSNPKASNEKM